MIAADMCAGCLGDDRHTNNRSRGLKHIADEVEGTRFKPCAPTFNWVQRRLRMSADCFRGQRSGDQTGRKQKAVIIQWGNNKLLGTIECAGPNGRRKRRHGASQNSPRSLAVYLPRYSTVYTERCAHCIVGPLSSRLLVIVFRFVPRYPIE